MYLPWISDDVMCNVGVEVMEPHTVRAHSVFLDEEGGHVGRSSSGLCELGKLRVAHYLLP